MKLDKVVFACVCVLVGTYFVDLKGEPGSQEVLRIAELRVPESPFACVPDQNKALPGGACSEAFVFSAQNPRDGKLWTFRHEYACG